MTTENEALRAQIEEVERGVMVGWPASRVFTQMRQLIAALAAPAAAPSEGGDNSVWRYSAVSALEYLRAGDTENAIGVLDAALAVNELPAHAAAPSDAGRADALRTLARQVDDAARKHDDGELRRVGEAIAALAPDDVPTGAAAEAVACKIGDYGTVDPIEMATVLLMDEGRKVAECYREEDARWIAGLINASPTTTPGAVLVPFSVRMAAERTRADLGPDGKNYPDIRALLAFVEATHCSRPR